MSMLPYPGVEKENPVMPWQEDGWVPLTAGGKQKSPNQVRNELQRYIDASSETQTYILNNLLQVNNNSFRKFMNPKTYKDQWSACQNGTYWAAARLLEQHKLEQKLSKKKTAGTKRKDAPLAENGTAKKSKAAATSEMNDYIERVLAVELPEADKVYDSCQEIVKKMKDFLQRDGASKASLCRALDNLNTNSLNRFIASKSQDGCGMAAYPRAYNFFEKMRLLENAPKTKKRLKNETEHPVGFSLASPPSNKGWYIVPR